VFAYEPSGSAAFAYEKLVREVIRDDRQIGADVRSAKEIEPDR
jgi:hypothetical protein